MNVKLKAGIAIACSVTFLLIAGTLAALAQTTTAGVALVPLGYCQLTSLGSAVLVSSCSGGIPAGANVAYVTAEAQAVRWRDDGTAPTASVGVPLASGGAILYVGQLSALRVIEQTSGAKINVAFYKVP